MAAPMCVARMLTSKRLFAFVRFQCYSKNLAGVEASKERKRKIPKVALDPKQNPYIPYVEGDPVQQAVVDQTPYRDTTKNQKRPYTKTVNELSLVNEDNDKKPKKKKKIQSKKSKTSTKPDLLSQISTNEASEIEEKASVQKVSLKSGAEYTYLSSKDKRLVSNMLRVSSKRKREINKEILVVGILSIRHAAVLGMTPSILFFTSHSSMDHYCTEDIRNTIEKAELYKVSGSSLKAWASSARIKANYAGIFPMPEPDTQVNPDRPTIPVTLVCDNVKQDQGLGTLIHTAVCIGCQQVLLINGCGDVWHPEVLVQGKGSHFDIPIRQHLTWSEALEHLPSVDKKFYLVDTSKKQEETILKGSEQLKISEEIDRANETELYDQSENEVETRETSDSETNDNDNELVETDSEMEVTESVEEIPEIYKQAAVDVQSYRDIDYTAGHAVIVVNGKYSGPSVETRKVLYDNFGLGVEVPKYEGGAKWPCSISGTITLMEVAQKFNQMKKREESNE